MPGPVLIILCIIAAIVVDVVLAIEFSKIAQDKGYYEDKYFIIALLLGIPGYILIAAMPDKNARPINTSESSNSSADDNDELPDL